MVEYILSSHAKERMAERSITEKLIREAMASPTKILHDSRKRILIKKLYGMKGKERLLLIAGEMTGEKLKIITVIDTTKIKKYL